MSVLRRLVLAALFVLCSGAASAQEAGDDADRVSTPVTVAPETATALRATRPAIVANRWAEDWSVLADPKARTGSFDAGKYIPLSDRDPQRYLSFGAMLRERWELLGNPVFGTGGLRRQSYLLQRLQAYADLHLDAHWRAFVELEDDRAPAKRNAGSADVDPLDLRLAFLEYGGTLGGAVIKARAGRQDFQFDLQRFISSRDGPNVRQSFDALWADWELKPWRVLALASRPVQYSPSGVFNDHETHRVVFSLLRIERHLSGRNGLSAYIAEYDRDGARFLDARGNERRHVLDVRLAGTAQGWDWDAEAMGQLGRVGAARIRAYAIGSRVGYSVAHLPWSPRLGLQFDLASGDRHAGDGTLGTFNPLFPNGYYFTLAGFTGYANVVHLKPSLTVSPLPRLKVALATGLLWRMTRADAVYTQPTNPVAGTAGHGNRWTGVYAQLRTDYAFTANLTGAIEAVRYQAGETLHAAGGRDASYMGTELKLSW